MSKKEYTLEEYEKYYKEKIEFLSTVATEALDEKLIDICVKAMQNLKADFKKVLLAKPGTTVELDEMIIKIN